MQMTDREKTCAECDPVRTIGSLRWSTQRDHFVGQNGKQEFVEALEDKTSYAVAMGVRTVGSGMANKIRDL